MFWNRKYNMNIDIVEKNSVITRLTHKKIHVYDRDALVSNSDKTAPCSLISRFASSR
jgi:hypothetical protein